MDRERIHTQLVSVLIAEDDRRSQKERHPNIHRIGHFLRALDSAEKEADLSVGLRNAFEHSRLLTRMLKIVDAASE